MRAASFIYALTLGVSAHAMAAAAGPDDPDRVIVRQGGAAVTLLDVDAYARSMPRDIRAQAFADPRAIETILRNLLASKQLAAEAHKTGLEGDPVIAREMQQAADKVLVDEHIKSLRAYYAANVPDQSLLAKERYMADPTAYATPRVVDVQHILIGTEERPDAEAKALAARLETELAKDPSRFDAYVEEYSDDKGKARDEVKGLVPDATSRQYVQEFRNAAEKLVKVGEIAGPVKTQFGYHVLKVWKITPPRQPSFDEIRPALIEQLDADYVSRMVNDHLDGVRSRELHPDMDLVKSLTTRFVEAPPVKPIAPPTDAGGKD